MSKEERIKVDLEAWKLRREKFYKRMLRDLETGYFDIEIYPVVNVVFKLRNAFPTSSCAGRVVILAARVPWRKREVKILHKSHSVVGLENTISKLIEGSEEDLWLTVQPPILHVSCNNLETASKLLDSARKAGFKHSGILSISSRGYHLEIRGSENLVFPLKIRGKRVVRKDSIKIVVKEVERILKEAKSRIKRLRKSVEQLLTSLEL